MVGYINITGEIGTDTTIDTVRRQVETQKGATEYVLFVDSNGGSVYQGFKIRDYLLSLKKPIKTKILGFQGSMATVIGLVGKVIAGKHAEHLYHLPTADIGGTAEEIQNRLVALKRIEDKIIEIYRDKSGKSEDEIRALLKKDTPISTAEAIDFGLVDELEEELKAVAKYDFENLIKTDKLMEVKSTVAEIFKNLAKAFEPKSMVVIKTEDGQPVVGAEVTVDGEPAPDGEHELANGVKIVVKDGKIESVMTDNVEDMKKEIEALKAELAGYKEKEKDKEAMQAQLEEAQTKIQDMTTQVVEVKAQFDALKKSLEKELPANLYNTVVMGGTPIEPKVVKKEKETKSDFGSMLLSLTGHN